MATSVVIEVAVGMAIALAAVGVAVGGSGLGGPMPSPGVQLDRRSGFSSLIPMIPGAIADSQQVIEPRSCIVPRNRWRITLVSFEQFADQHALALLSENEFVRFQWDDEEWWRSGDIAVRVTKRDAGRIDYNVVGRLNDARTWARTC